MRPDLNRLRQNLDDVSDIADALELDLVNDPKWQKPSDISYLSDQDRANPDIMSNVEAMSATNELISWFGKDMEGYLGLWHGPTLIFAAISNSSPHPA